MRYVSGATASGLRDEGRLSEGVGLLRPVRVHGERADLLLPALREVQLPAVSPDSGMRMAPQQFGHRFGLRDPGGRYRGGRATGKDRESGVYVVGLGSLEEFAKWDGGTRKGASPSRATDGTRR